MVGRPHVKSTYMAPDESFTLTMYASTPFDVASRVALTPPVIVRVDVECAGVSRSEVVGSAKGHSTLVPGLCSLYAAVQVTSSATAAPATAHAGTRKMRARRRVSMMPAPHRRPGV